MSCGTAQVSYQGIRISLKLLTVFPRALAARGASDLTGPSPSRRQETASRNPRRVDSTPLSSSAMPTASGRFCLWRAAAPAEAVLTGIRRKTGSTEAISRKHSRTNALTSETVKTRGRDHLTPRLGLIFQGAAPCPARRWVIPRPVSSPAFRSDIGTWAGGTARRPFFTRTSARRRGREASATLLGLKQLDNARRRKRTAFRPRPFIRCCSAAPAAGACARGG